MGIYPLRYDTSATPTITETSGVPVIADGVPGAGTAGFHEWGGEAVQFGTVAAVRGQLNAGQGRYSVMDPAYGAKGDGVTDDTAAIAAAEAARPAGAELYFPPGTYKVNPTYDGSSGEKAKLLKISKAGEWRFGGPGAKLLWGSAFTLSSGTDGGGLGMVNVIASGVSFSGMGTLDGASQVQYPLCISGPVSNTGVHLTIQNTLEGIAAWCGMTFTVSADIGGSTSGRATNVYGVLSRPTCPIWDAASNTITAHADRTAVLIPGTNLMSNYTGHALVQSGTEMDCFNAMLHMIGVPNFISGHNVNNNGFADFSAYDVGCCVIEQYGPHRQVYGIADPTWAAGTIAIDANTGNTIFITASTNVAATIGNPANAPSVSRQSQRLRFVFYNSSGGGLTTPIAWDTKYRNTGTVSPASTKYLVVEFEYDKRNDLWVELTRSGSI